MTEQLDDRDKDLLRALQEGLPLVAHPFKEVADGLGSVLAPPRAHCNLRPGTLLELLNAIVSAVYHVDIVAAVYGSVR